MFQFSKVPLVRLLLPFCLGLILQKSSNSLVFEELFWFFIIAAFILFSSLFLLQSNISKSFKRRWMFGAFSSFLLLILGLCYGFQFNEINSPNTAKDLANTKWVGEVKSSRISKSGNYNYVVDVSMYRQDKRWLREGFLMLMYSKSGESSYVAEVGDVISGFSNINSINGPKNPVEFDYREYCNNRGIYYSTFENEAQFLSHNLTINSIAEESRRTIIQWFVDLGIAGDELAVLSALTLGDKSGLRDELKTNYAAAGAMHILAVSGLHVGIIYLIFNHFLKLIRNNKNWMRWLKALLLLIVVWSYAFITGFSPSVQRAACMFSFIIVSTALKRHSHIINSIAGSAFLIILINPNIIYEVGFQLSYAAVLGIVIVHPIIYPLLSLKYPLIDKIWSLSIVSLSAQLATLPLIIFYFHQFPNWFLLVNLFVIPLAFLIVSVSVFTCLLWGLFKVHLGLAWLLKVLLMSLNYIIDCSQLLPFSVTEGIWISNGSVIILVLAVILFMAYLQTKSFKHLRIALVFLFIISIIELFSDIQQLSKKSIGFYALKGTPISFVNGLKAEVMMPQQLNNYEKDIILNHLNSLGIREIKWVFRTNFPLDLMNFDFQDFNNNLLLSSLSKTIFYLNNDSIQLDPALSNQIIVLNNPSSLYVDEPKSQERLKIIPVGTPYWHKFDIESKSIHDLRFEGYFELTNF